MQTFGKQTRESEAKEPETVKPSTAIVVLIGVVLVIGLIVGPRGEQTADEIAAKCFSNWNGSSRELVRRVKNTLRDPGSFEHVETRRTQPNGAGQIVVRMVYRARNGFGGMVVETAYGTIRIRDCALIG